MTSMLERVARALMRADGQTTDTHFMGDYMILAHAAIQAMREPDHAMTEALYAKADYSCDDRGLWTSPVDAYQAAIDAATQAVGEAEG